MHFFFFNPSPQSSRSARYIWRPRVENVLFLSIWISSLLQAYRYSSVVFPPYFLVSVTIVCIGCRLSICYEMNSCIFSMELHNIHFSCGIKKIFCPSLCALVWVFQELSSPPAMEIHWRGHLVVCLLDMQRRFRWRIHIWQLYESFSFHTEIIAYEIYKSVLMLCGRSIVREINFEHFPFISSPYNVFKHGARWRL